MSTGCRAGRHRRALPGRHNAGHTLVINGEKPTKLALLPSGVLRPSKLA